MKHDTVQSHLNIYIREFLNFLSQIFFYNFKSIFYNNNILHKGNKLFVHSNVNIYHLIL